MRPLLPALVLTAGCAIGPSLSSFPPAASPGGVEVTLGLHAGPTVAGELLAVEEAALLLVTAEGELLRAALAGVVRLWARYGRYPLPLSDASKARLRALARYPEGVSPGLERRLVEVYGRREVTVVGGR
jgi:hypothetical protein